MRMLALTVLAAASAAAAALVLVGTIGAAPSAQGICLAPGAAHGDGEYEVVLGSGSSMAAVRPLTNRLVNFGFKNLEVEHAGRYWVKLYGLTSRSLLSQELAQLRKAQLHVVRIDTVFAPCR